MTDLTSDPTQWFPMPAAIITSRTADGKPNLMGIGYIGFMCWDPPVVCLGVNSARYSGEVIRATGEFVVAVPERGEVLGLDYCGFVSGADGDKFAATGFTTRAATRVRPPLINECPVNLECELIDVVKLGSHDVHLGKVVETHVAESYATGESRVEPLILISRRYVAASEQVCDFGASMSNPPVPAA